MFIEKVAVDLETFSQQLVEFSTRFLLDRVTRKPGNGDGIFALSDESCSSDLVGGPAQKKKAKG